MYDTLKLRSPVLTEEVGRAVEKRLETLQRWDGSSGLLLWELTNGQLVGSFDHRISCRVDWHETLFGKRCQVTIEGSVHKAMIGHNIHGGPTEIIPACRWFVNRVTQPDMLDIELPDGLEWEPRRVDFAEVFDLESFAAVEEFVRTMGKARYPRRAVNRYGNYGWMSPGTTTTIKLYHKGPEFKAHDRLRVRGALGYGAAADLEEQGNRFLRVEVEIKSKAIQAEYGKLCQVSDLSDEWFLSVFYRELQRVIDEGRTDMETVRVNVAVEERLKELYGEKAGGRLFVTWNVLALYGDDRARNTIGRSTFYSHKKLLVEAGVSWKGADVAELESNTHIPAGFTLARSDPRRVTAVDPLVQEIQRRYRMVA